MPTGHALSFDPSIAARSDLLEKLGKLESVFRDACGGGETLQMVAKLKRAAMDYGRSADVTKHASFDDFAEACRANGRRIMLMSSHAATRLPQVSFAPDDVLLMGSESAGVPDIVRDSVDARIRIPMAPGFRSLNIAVSAGIALSEALRQTGQYPE